MNLMAELKSLVNRWSKNHRGTCACRSGCGDSRASRNVYACG